MGRMAPARYQKHIGLAVPVKQLALAYYQTYGLTEDFSGRRGRRINVGAYRFAVRAFIPSIAHAVTLLHRKDEPPTPITPKSWLCARKSQRWPPRTTGSNTAIGLASGPILWPH